MPVNVGDAFEIPRQTPATLKSFLGELPDCWTGCNEGLETWSAFDIVGHMIHGEETDWIVQAKTILEHGEAKAFEPFDRFAMFERSRGKSLTQLLDEFAILRARNLETLRALGITPEQLAPRGTHPALGAVALGELIATWAVHDLSHIAQCAE